MSYLPVISSYDIQCMTYLVDSQRKTVTDTLLFRLKLINSHVVGSLLSRLIAKRSKKPKLANGDAEKSLINGNQSFSGVDDGLAGAQEMVVLDNSNNNKPLTDPSVPSDRSTLSSCHTPSQGSDVLSKRNSGRPPPAVRNDSSDHNAGK